MTAMTRTSAMQQRELHVVDRFADRLRPIHSDVERHRRRQLCANRREQCLDIVDHLHDVRSRLLLDHQADVPHALIPAGGLVLLDAVVHARHVSEPHGVAISVRDHHRGVRRRIQELAVGEHREDTIAAGHRAGRQVDVRRLHRGDDLIDADAVRRELPRIDVDADRVFLRSEHVHLRNAVHHGDALRDVGIGVLIHRRERKRWRPHDEQHDRIVAGIHLHVRRRRRHLRWKLTCRPRNHRLHVLRSGIDVAAQIELQDDARGALQVGGVHRRETGNRRELFFERQRHGRRHRFRTGAGQRGIDGNRREIDRRQVGDRQHAIRHHAEHDDAQRDERRRDWTLDEQGCEVHESAFCGVAPLMLMRLPGTSRSWPSVTTVSPGLTPSLRTVSAPAVRATTTGRISTV